MSYSGGNSGGGHTPTSSFGDTTKIKYIYDLPFFDRKEICRIFDENDQWEALGMRMRNILLLVIFSFS